MNGNDSKRVPTRKRGRLEEDEGAETGGPRKTQDLCAQERVRVELRVLVKEDKLSCLVGWGYHG